MIKKMEHVAIIVEDMEKSIDFYTTFFGYQLRTRGNNKTREMVFLYHENQLEVEIELIRDLVPTINYSMAGKVNHLAFTVENMEDAIEVFSNKGITFHSDLPKNSIEGRKTIFFDGPSGELLQFVESV